MNAPRICVKCGDRLKNQKRAHFSTKRQRPGASGGSKMSWPYHCTGPKQTPTTMARASGRVRKPMHFRPYAEDGTDSLLLLCGMKAKRWHNWHKANDGGETWTRVTNRPDRTTCEDCLAMLVELCSDRLGQRLALTGGTREAALSRARTRITMNGVESLVSNG